MWAAFINGVSAHLPKASLTFDKFHVVSLVNSAVDEVRRQELKLHPELSGTRYIWLKNPDNLTPNQEQQLDTFDLTRCHLKPLAPTKYAWSSKTSLNNLPGRLNSTSRDGISGLHTAASSPLSTSPKPFVVIRPEFSVGSLPRSTTASSKASIASFRPPRPKPGDTAPPAT
jgi:transposase